MVNLPREFAHSKLYLGLTMHANTIGKKQDTSYENKYLALDVDRSSTSCSLNLGSNSIK